MRSPGLSRMVHTRSFSVSDRSSEPTQPFGRSASRANSVFSAAGHSVLTCVLADFSFMVIAMAFSLPICPDRKSTRLNSSHDQISYAVFCLKKKKTQQLILPDRQSTHLNERHNRIENKVSSLKDKTRREMSNASEEMSAVHRRTCTVRMRVT